MCCRAWCDSQQNIISTLGPNIPFTKVNAKNRKNVKMQIFQGGKCTKKNTKVKITNIRISSEKSLRLKGNEGIHILKGEEDENIMRVRKK